MTEKHRVFRAQSLHSSHNKWQARWESPISHSQGAAASMTDKRQTPNTMETSPWDYARRGWVRGQPSEGPMTVPLLAGFSSVSTSIASPASSSREINEELLSIEQSNSSTPVPVKGLGDQVIDSIDSIDVSRCVDTPTSCSRSNSSTQL